MNIIQLSLTLISAVLKLPFESLSNCLASITSIPDKAINKDSFTDPFVFFKSRTAVTLSTDPISNKIPIALSNNLSLDTDKKSFYCHKPYLI